LRMKNGKLSAIAPLPEAGKTSPALVLTVPRTARSVGDKHGTVYL
jgi:hypothetical protein